MVICNSGDGSNHIQIIKSQKALGRVEQLAREGDEVYASGEGLQVRAIKFPDEFALDAWVIENFNGYNDEDILDAG